MLTLAALSRALGGLRVIDGLHLTVEAGEILGILGPNGAGKSTLFNVIAGVLPHPAGGVRECAGRRRPWRQNDHGARGESDAVPRRVGLAHRAETPAGQLGLLDMKQLELAKALAVRPRLLLLDEIAGGLTEAETETLVTTIRQVHAGGVTVVWIEHVIQTLLRLATRLCVLAGGGILADGAPNDVLADVRVRAAYLGT